MNPIELNQLKRLLKKFMKEHVGKKCKDFVFHCFSCQMWMAHDIIMEIVDDEIRYEKEN